MKKKKGGRRNSNGDGESKGFITAENIADR